MERLKSAMADDGSAEGCTCDDQALALRAAQGDTDAFEVLVGRYEKFVYRTAFFVTGKREDADDLSQEIFLKLWNGLPRFRGECRFVTYLNRIAHNAAVDWVRARRNRPETVPLQPAEDDENGPSILQEPAAAPEDSDPTEIFGRKTRAELLRDAVRQLSEEHRIIVQLRDAEGMPYERIAAVLGVSTGTVKSRLFRARSQMKKYLEAHGFFS